jgi:hypothetical protein
VDDARAQLRLMLRSNDFDTLRSTFLSCVNALRAVEEALKAEGNGAVGFEEWWHSRERDLRQDELMRFIHDVRIDDFHRAKGHRVLVGRTLVEHISTSELGERPPGANGLAIGPEGPFWVVDARKPTERRVPITSGGSWRLGISLATAPTSHDGKPLDRNDPFTICSLGIEYLFRVVVQARTRFRPVRGPTNTGPPTTHTRTEPASP